jgi:undecaprenyl-diphosphatase
MVSADKGFKWGIIPVITPDLNAEREQLYRDLLQANKINTSLKMQIRNPEIGYNFKGDPFFSDGYMYVLSLQ